MTRSWMTRLTASFSAIALLGGMTFLSGCNDCDDCDHHDVSCSDCDNGCSDATINTSYEGTSNPTYESYESRPAQTAPVDDSHQAWGTPSNDTGVKVYTGRSETVPASDIESRRIENNINVYDRSNLERERLDREHNADFRDREFHKDLNAPAANRDIDSKTDVNVDRSKVDSKADVNVDRSKVDNNGNVKTNEEPFKANNSSSNAASPSAPAASAPAATPPSGPSAMDHSAPSPAAPAPAADQKSDFKSDLDKSNSDLKSDASHGSDVKGDLKNEPTSSSNTGVQGADREVNTNKDSSMLNANDKSSLDSSATPSAKTSSDNAINTSTEDKSSMDKSAPMSSNSSDMNKDNDAKKTDSTPGSTSEPSK